MIIGVDPPRTELRRAGPADAEVAAALRQSAMTDPWERPWGVASVGLLLRDPGVLATLALQDAAPVGTSFIRLAGDEAEVLALAVVPDRRRRGIGRTLIDAAARDCALAGVARLFLEVAEPNAPARALYASCGFRQVGHRPGYYRGIGVAVDALLLVRDLPADRKRQ